MVIALQFATGWLIAAMEQAMPLAAAGIHPIGPDQLLGDRDVDPVSRRTQPVAVLFSEQADPALNPPQGTVSVATVIAQWPAAAGPDQANDRPLPSGDAGRQEIRAWCHPSAGLEVPLR